MPKNINWLPRGQKRLPPKELHPDDEVWVAFASPASRLSPNYGLASQWDWAESGPYRITHYALKERANAQAS